MAKTKNQKTTSQPTSFDLGDALNRDLQALLSGADSPAFSETLAVLRDASALALRTQEEARQKHREMLKERTEILAAGLRKQAASVDDRLARRKQEVAAVSEESFVLAGRVFDSQKGIGLPSVQVQLKSRLANSETVVAETRTDDLGHYRLELKEGKPGETRHPGLEAFKDKTDLYLEVLDEEGQPAFSSSAAIDVCLGKATFVESPVEGDRFPQSLRRGQQEQLRVKAEIGHARRSLAELESRLNIRLGRPSVLRDTGGGKTGRGGSRDTSAKAQPEK